MAEQFKEEFHIADNTLTYLKIGFLSFFVIPGLTRNPVTLPFYYKKQRIANCQFRILKSLDTDFRRYDLILR